MAAFIIIIIINAFGRLFLSKATYVAFKVYILLVHAFSENQTHDLCVAINNNNNKKIVN